MGDHAAECDVMCILGVLNDFMQLLLMLVSLLGSC